MRIQKNSNKELRSRFKKQLKAKKSSDDGLIRLNKYIARTGICSRREADKFIEAGIIKVNNKVITQMGYKVKPTDHVMFNNSKLRSEASRYLLLNKPKNYSGRMEPNPKKKDVFQLIKGACKETILPTCRLNKLASGLLLFTNDFELAKKLLNPKKRIKEIFHLELDKNLKSIDLKNIKDGITIGGKKMSVDNISYIKGKNKNEIGVEISIGGIKIINQIFKQLGYNIFRLDRVFFACLNKKYLPRKKYRFLTKEEIILLKRI